jgi:hypothetical protein
MHYIRRMLSCIHACIAIVLWLSNALMHNIEAYCWVFGHAVYAQVVNLITHTCEFHTYSSVRPRCGWAMVLMDNIRACFGYVYIVYAQVVRLINYTWRAEYTQYCVATSLWLSSDVMHNIRACLWVYIPFAHTVKFHSWSLTHVESQTDRVAASLWLSNDADA